MQVHQNLFEYLTCSNWYLDLAFEKLLNGIKFPGWRKICKGNLRFLILSSHFQKIIVGIEVDADQASCSSKFVRNHNI